MPDQKQYTALYQTESLLQSAMTANHTEGKWAILSRNKHISSAGIDWKPWEEEHPKPVVYAPPQLDIGYYTPGAGRCLLAPHFMCSCLSSRSFCCPGLSTCCLNGAKRVTLTSPAASDNFLKEMLQHEDPLTPELLRGVFWMRDNVTAPETLVTLSDAEWVSPALGLKTQKYNWTRDDTCFGFGFIRNSVPAEKSQDPASGFVRLDLSPSGKWIWMTNDQLVYIPQPGDVFTDTSGNVLDLPPGSLIRVSYAGEEPPFKVAYQYLLVPVARKQADGSVVKTAAFDDLVAQMEAKGHYRLRCCGVGWCLNDKEFMEATVELSPHHVYIPKQQEMSV